ncbi:MAG: BLUF domain-containing protein [Bacteroidota bacterium]
MLVKLLYKSNRTEECTEQDIAQILESAQRNNGPMGITGMLLYDRSSFIQYLEGPSGPVSDLYEIIRKDPRHKDVRMIIFGPAKKRIFPSWAMDSKEVNTQKLALNANLSLENREVIENILKGETVESDRAIEWLTTFVNEV